MGLCYAVQLGYNPGPQLLDIVSRRAYQMLHQYSLQELSHLLWALAIFEHYPGLPHACLMAQMVAHVWSHVQSCREVWTVLYTSKVQIG